MAKAAMEEGGLLNPRKRLIVNADDFGKSAGANQATIQAHAHGILTTASLMVNEPGFTEAVALARQQPRLGVGLHLTLVDGHASLPPAQVPGLVDAQGRFPPDPARAGWRYFFVRRLRAPLHAEIEAQFAKFRATGLPLDHVNGHHHLHMHPRIMGYLLEQAGPLGITRMRLMREPLRTQWRAGARFSLARCGHVLAHRLLARRARLAFRRLSIRHPDAVFGLLNDGAVDEACLARLLPVLPAGNSEVYSHPSLDQFTHELQALLSPRLRALVQTLGLELIRYQDL